MFFKDNIKEIGHYRRKPHHDKAINLFSNLMAKEKRFALYLPIWRHVTFVDNMLHLSWRRNNRNVSNGAWQMWTYFMQILIVNLTLFNDYKVGVVS